MVEHSPQILASEQKATNRLYVRSTDFLFQKATDRLYERSTDFLFQEVTDRLYERSTDLLFQKATNRLYERSTDFLFQKEKREEAIFYLHTFVNRIWTIQFTRCVRSINRSKNVPRPEFIFE